MQRVGMRDCKICCSDSLDSNDLDWKPCADTSSVSASAFNAKTLLT
jgi:hypothetical protein